MKRVPAETPQWRARFDRATTLRHVGRVRVFKDYGAWFFVSERIRPDRFADRERWLS